MDRFITNSTVLVRHPFRGDLLRVARMGAIACIATVTAKQAMQNGREGVTIFDAIATKLHM
ncbi:MAG: hypothetical protein AAFR12_21215 [Cyanobacteria bacterium J06626_6]